MEQGRGWGGAGKGVGWCRQGGEVEQGKKVGWSRGGWAEAGEGVGGERERFRTGRSNH